MSLMLHRRDALRLAAATLLTGKLGVAQEPKLRGHVAAGASPFAAQVGNDMLAAGGTAIDAAIAAAFAAGVTGFNDVGIGGYGGTAVIYHAATKKIASLDFNSIAPKAAKAGMFLGEAAQGPQGPANSYGWKAVGVPGILAGLEHLAKHHATKSFGDLLLPALKLARDGFPLAADKANSIRTNAPRLKLDSGAAKIFLPGGEPPKAGSTFKNPDLAAMLQDFVDQNSADGFYRGKAAKALAAAMRKHGGLVTEDDLAAYQPREVEPVTLTWGKFTIHTAPLTAGGPTALHALAVMKALGWEQWPQQDEKAYHTRLEVLRAVWQDRLKYMGDPGFVDPQIDRLMSEDHAKKTAERVRAAVAAGKPLAGGTDGRPADGTTHISAADTAGNLAAITVTHGGSYGACVAAEGLGLVLGHGMVRFDLTAGKANSIAPGKRPLNNMCPTIVFHDGKPRLATGGRGGRKIPNTLFEMLLHYVGKDGGLEVALAAKRLHTEGDQNLLLEVNYPKTMADYFAKVGYTVKTQAAAMVSAVELDAAGTTRAAVR